MNDARKGAMIALLIPSALLAGAYTSEWFGLVACEMCWWQRWAHMAAIAPALLAVAMAFRRPAAQSVMTRKAMLAGTLVAALAILASGVIGGYHAGIENGWWQGHTVCTAPTGGMTLDDMARSAASGIVRCDEAQWRFIGISLAGWNAVISMTGAILAAWLSINRRRT